MSNTENEYFKLNTKKALNIKETHRCIEREIRYIYSYLYPCSRAISIIKKT